MPCDSRIPLGMTPAVRKKQIEVAMERLAKALATGEIKIKVGLTGGLAFTGAAVGGVLGNGTNRITDLCAYRKLLASGSKELRQALASAELQAGRKVDPQAVAKGVHSHDGGKTWGTH